MQSSLRIVAWNANGLVQRAQMLEAFLWSEKIDVCLVSETHMKRDSYCKIRGYRVYHTVRPDKVGKGGTAVVIKENINHFEQINYETSAIQATAVNVKTKSKDITIVAIYCPPGQALGKSDYLQFFQVIGDRFIIGGDFNAKHTYWGSANITPKGRQLLAAAEARSCHFQSTGKPTYWPSDPAKTPSLIDFFVLRGIASKYVTIEENIDLASDHTAIVLSLSESVISRTHPPKLANKLTDWEEFRKELEQRINLSVPLKANDQLDHEVEKLVTDLQQSVWNNTPILKPKTPGLNYVKEVRSMVQEKRKARKKWQQSRSPEDKRVLNKLTQQLKEEIKIIKNESFQSFLRELTDDKDTDYSLWRAAKILKRPIKYAPPIRRDDGEWARSDREKAEVFAEYLTNVFQPHSPTGMEDIVPVNNTDHSLVRKFTPAEVINEIEKKLKINKAPGYDLITVKILKELPYKCIIKLTHLFNAAVRLRYVPIQWKIAEVIMIPKPGKTLEEKSSYRPISLLPTIGKLFERLLLNRLKPIIEARHIFPNHQFGFRSRHSTIDQVHRITDVIERSLEEKKICATVFLDVAQAFDKVWHEGLESKLDRCLPRQMSEILKSYISDRYFRVKHGEDYSGLKSIAAGVPQGSVLGPTLYLLYTSDIPKNDGVLTATFADDTALLATGQDMQTTIAKLQSAINNVNSWTRKWRIKLNEGKSTHVNFTNKHYVYLPVMINGQIVPHANEAKYLGMTLDAKLRWKSHVKKKREQLGMKYRQMYWLIGGNSELSVHNKLLLYKQVLKPIWIYGIQLWGCTKKSNIQVMQTLQNKVLRCIVRAPWYIRNADIHRDLKVPLVAEEVQRYAGKHATRLSGHQNVEVAHLISNVPQVRRLKRKKPVDLVQD